MTESEVYRLMDKMNKRFKAYDVARREAGIPGMNLRKKQTRGSRKSASKKHRDKTIDNKLSELREKVVR